MFQEPSGPPWIHSASGAGWSAEAPSGSASQDRIRTPSSVLVSTSCRVPGSAGPRDRAAQRGHLAGGQVDPDHLGREGVARPERVRAGAVGGHQEIGVGGVVGGQPARFVDGEVDPEHRGPAVLIGDHEQPGGVGQPARRGRPAVPVGGELPGRRPVDAGDPERGPRCRGRRRQRLAQVGHQPAVRADPGVAEVGTGVVDDPPALTGGDLDRLQHSAGHAPAHRYGDVGDQQPAVVGQGRCGVDQAGADRRDQVGQFERARVGLAGRLVALLVGRVGRLRRPGQRAGEQPRRVRAEVLIPVADRVAGVQDRLDLGVGPQVAQALLGFGVGGRGQGARDDQHRVPRRRCRDRRDAAGPPGQQPRLAAAAGQQPERRLRLVLRRLALGPPGHEQQVATGAERRLALPLGAAGEPPGRSAAERIHLPQRADVRGLLAVQCGHRGHQASTVRRQGERGHPRQGEIGVEVVERGRRGGVDRRLFGGGHTGVPIIRRHPARPGPLIPDGRVLDEPGRWQ